MWYQPLYKHLGNRLTVMCMRNNPAIYAIGIVMVLIISSTLVMTGEDSEAKPAYQRDETTHIHMDIEYDEVREFTEYGRFIRIDLEGGASRMGEEGIHRPFIPVVLRIPGILEDLSVDFKGSEKTRIRPGPWISPGIEGIHDGELHLDWDGKLEKPVENGYELDRISEYRDGDERGWIYSLKLFPVSHPDGESSCISREVDIEYSYAPLSETFDSFIENRKPVGDIDYLIITDESLADSLIPLAQLKSSKGIITEITTTREIYRMYDSGDKAEKMRSYVKDMEASYDLDYLLLAGDYDKVPTRLTYNPYPCNMMGVNEPSNFASDSYFACVDRGSSWNTDGDKRIGEHSDLDDVVPDLAVGRMAINDNMKMKEMVLSLIDREINRSVGDDEDIQVYIAGDPGRNPGSVTSVMDYFWDTYGEDQFPGHDTMYYDGTGNLSFGTSGFLNMLESGHQFMGYFAHGKFDNIPNLVTASDIENMDEGDPAGFFFAMACVNGMFDDPTQGNIGGTGDCFAETMTENPGKGVVAYMAASRLSMGAIDTSYSGDAPGLMEDYWRSVEKAAKGQIPATSGDIYRDSQTHFSSTFYPFPNSMMDGSHRTFLEYNLLGEPEAPAILEDTEDLQMEYVIGPDKGWIEVTVTDSWGDPVPSANVTLFRLSELGKTSVTDSDGIVNISIPESNGGDVQLSSYKKGYKPETTGITLPDTLAPEGFHRIDPSTPDGENGYYVNTPNITIYGDEPVDVNYHWDHNEMISLPGPISLNGVEGNHTLEYRVVDSAGLRSDLVSLELAVDKTSPDLLVDVDPPSPDGENGCYITPPMLTLGSNEKLNAPLWKLDSGDWNIYSGPIGLDDGDHTVVFRAKDMAGNYNETVSNLKVDLSYPVTDLRISHDPSGENGYYVMTPNITLDVAGELEKFIRYRWDGGEWINYSGPFNPPEGIHLLEYRSGDLAGNEEPIRDRTFKVDTSAPSIEIEISPSEPDGSGGFYNSTPEVTITSDDGAIEFMIREGMGSPSWDDSLEYTDPIMIPEGEWILYIKATDEAGNTLEYDPLSFNVDTEPPSLNWHVEPGIPGGDNGWYTTNPVIVLDNRSIDLEVYYKLNGEGSWEIAGDRTTVPEGIHDPLLKVSDPAGNIRTYQVGRLMVDLERPVLEITSPEDGSENGPGLIHVEWMGNDTVSGADEYLVKVDEGGWESCGGSSSTNIGPLETGTHRVVVKVLDESGWSASRSIHLFVDSDEPEPLSWSPKGENVSVYTSLEITFSETMDWDNISISLDGVNGSVGHMENTLFFEPDSKLEGSKEYQVIVNGVDLNGNRLEPFSWSFTTEVTETPAEEKGEEDESSHALLIGLILAVLAVLLAIAASALVFIRKRTPGEE